MTSNEQRCKDAVQTLECELERHVCAEKLKPLGAIVTTLTILLFVGSGTYLLTAAGGTDDSETVDESMTPVELAVLTTTSISGEEVPMRHSFPLPGTVNCNYPGGGETSRGIDKPATDSVLATGTVTITLKTNRGNIPMELDRTISPCGVNAIGYMAEPNYFNDVVCHHIADGGLDVLQYSNPTGTSIGSPGFKFTDEWPAKDSGLDQSTPLVYSRGSIAMTSPSDPDANGNQFLLSWADSQLPP